MRNIVKFELTKVRIKYLKINLHTMLVEDLINDSLIPLKTSDTGSNALSMMDEYRVSHLPVVNNTDFLGLISDEEILSVNNIDGPIGNYKLSLTTPSVTRYQHIYEVCKVFSSLELTLIPVVDNKNKYLGVITLKTLIHNISKIAAINNPGGIIILEINVNDYVLTEIAQIVESNDAKVLSVYITTHDNSTKLDVTLKINKIDINSILQTFNRYNYIIKASYSETDYRDDLQDRYDSLMNYLSI